MSESQRLHSETQLFVTDPMTSFAVNPVFDASGAFVHNLIFIRYRHENGCHVRHVIAAGDFTTTPARVETEEEFAARKAREDVQRKVIRKKCAAQAGKDSRASDEEVYDRIRQEVQQAVDDGGVFVVRRDGG